MTRINTDFFSQETSRFSQERTRLSQETKNKASNYQFAGSKRWVCMLQTVGLHGSEKEHLKTVS